MHGLPSPQVRGKRTNRPLGGYLYRTAMAKEQFCEPMIENDCARTEADKRVTVGRNAFIEPCELGPAQSCLVDNSFHFSPPRLRQRSYRMLQITPAPFPRPRDEGQAHVA